VAITAWPWRSPSPASSPTARPWDEVVLRLNREAATQLRAQWRLEIVPGATHLFEEPGALDEVTRLAGDWFVAHVSR
jgi:hypothetical protein